MKKLLLIIISVSITFIAFSDTVIQMEPYGGVYRIPCVVNGAKMKFIFDTGASNVCISMTMAEYLYDNGYLEDNDIKGVGSSSVADGRIVDHIKILLRDIQIENLHINNVEAIVVDGQNAPLLMGQSAIQKLGKIELNGSTLVIKNGLDSNEDYIDKLFDEAQYALDNHLYGKAVEAYSKLYSMNELSDYGLYMYANACFLNYEESKALEILNQVKDYSYFEENKIDIYRFLGFLNDFESNYNEAIAYYEMSNKIFHNNIQDKSEQEAIFNNWMYEANCYFHMNDYKNAAKHYGLAAAIFSDIHDVDMKYIRRDSKNQLKKKEKSFRNDDIDYVLYQLILCQERSGAWSTEDFLFEATAMARAGNKHAMKMCNDAGIDPYSSLWR